MPELFLVTNFANTGYSSLHSDGFHCTRETYNNYLTEDKSPLAEHRESVYRRMVHDLLVHENAMFLYNNGDPRMFNPVAFALLNSLSELRKRGSLKDRDSVETYRQLAMTAIDVVSNIQEKFVIQERVPLPGSERGYVIRGRRKIGGRRHALAVTPTGEYLPQSGDL